MIYRDFQGIKLSGLGMGNMRLPVVDGNDSKVDLAEAEKIIDYAYEHGVNYFDTAYGYHGGTSEAAVRNALSKYPRESYYLADKFPGYDLSNMPKVKEIFEEQLERCGVDYFDFYLFHNVCELNIEQYLDPQYGIFDYLMEQKRNGLIKHLGFSCHGNMPVLKRFLEAYGEHMEFCQLQLNYVDWSFQHLEQVQLRLARRSARSKEVSSLMPRLRMPEWSRMGRTSASSARSSPSMASAREQRHIAGHPTLWKCCLRP